MKKRDHGKAIALGMGVYALAILTNLIGSEFTESIDLSLGLFVYFTLIYLVGRGVMSIKKGN